MKRDATAMAAHPNVSVSVEEYVARFIDRSEKPVCEYVDGVLVPKPMVGDDHSAIQSNLVFYLRLRYNETLKIRPELHTRLKQTRFRVPDVAVIDRRPRNPVLLCVEIKSPDDSLQQLWDKCRECHTWDVPYCWVIEPDNRRLWEFHAADVARRQCGEQLSADNVKVASSEVFEDV